MADELAERLDTIAAAMAAMWFEPTGQSTIRFRFLVKRQDHRLIFEHGTIKLVIDNWELVAPDRRLEVRGMPYPPILNNRIRRYFYQGHILWWVKEKAKGDGDCVFGFWYSREQLLQGLDPTSVQWATINLLLHWLDNYLGQAFGTGLLGEQVAAETKSRLEDRGIREKVF